MNEKALHTLEYDKIITRLSACATSGPGKEKCKSLAPLYDLSQIESMQEETSAALSRIFAKGSISFGNTYDIRGSLKRLEIDQWQAEKNDLVRRGLETEEDRARYEALQRRLAEADNAPDARGAGESGVLDI